MASSSAKTVDQYLRELPAERRREVERVRDLVRANLPDGYRESVSWGMIAYAIPLERYPKTYNGHPLGYLALAAQKNYFALYMLGPMMDPTQRERLEQAYDDAGKRLDMGKSCLRFRRAAELPLDLIGELIAEMPVERYVALYEKLHPSGGALGGHSARKTKPKKATAKKAASKKTSARKTTAKKATARKSATRRTARKR